MQNTQESSQDDMTTPPRGFMSLKSVLSMSNEDVIKKKPLVNIIGVVTDVQPARYFRGLDYKMTVTLTDLSIKGSYEDVFKVNIFKPLEKMPEIKSPGQVVHIKGIRVQFYMQAVSVITTYGTEISVFSAAKVKWPIVSAADLPTHTPKVRPIKREEAMYVAMLQNKLWEDVIPSAVEFEEKSIMAMNVKEKFAELQNIKKDTFHDLLGEVVSMHKVNEAMVTVYITDYTTNELFYPVPRSGGAVADEPEDDPYGYLAGKRPKPMKTDDGEDWKGPYGKMSMQLTAFDQQGQCFIDNLKPGSWVKLSNIHVCLSSGGHLEGKLRNDRMYPEKILVEGLDIKDPTSMNDRWKNAIRRKRDWVKERDAEAEDRKLEAGVTGKRKADEEPEKGKKKNAKQRREEARRAALLKAKEKAPEGAAKVAIEVGRPEPSIELNKNIRNKASSDPASRIPITLKDILEYRPAIELGNGSSVVVPFTNSKYRAYIRVTDFFPHDIADFAVGKKVSEFDVLTDNEDSSSDQGIPIPKGDLTDHVKNYAGWSWKWKFMLQVEDALKPEDCKLGKPRPRMWLSIDNDSGQFLLNCEATNLRANKSTLHKVKEKLFVLWGDLEERKTAYLTSQEGRILQSRTFAVHGGTPEPSTLESSPIAARTAAKFGDMPADSDDELDRSTALQSQLPPRGDQNTPSKLKRLRPAEAGNRLAKELSKIGNECQNKPFEACICEWGVRVHTVDGAPTYKRVWGLFDTVIL